MTQAPEHGNFAAVKHLADIASVLVAQAPRQQAANVLSLLAARARATGGALLTLRDHVLVLFCSTPDLPAAAVVRAWAAWDSHRQTIEAGETVQTPEHVLAPIRDEGLLVGLLFLDGAKGFDQPLLSTFGLVLAKAVQTDARSMTAAGDAAAELLGMPEQSRERMVDLLRRNEWNIARVARVMGVTRRTIYLRLARYGIPRERVPRSNTSRRPRPAAS